MLSQMAVVSGQRPRKIVVKYCETSSSWPPHCFEASDYRSRLFLLFTLDIRIV